MSGLWSNNNCFYVFAKDKLRIGLSVKKKEKIYFRMGFGDSGQRFVCKPANSIEPVPDKQPGINGNPCPGHYFLGETMMNKS
jgi:hypothetical protein